jgi:hypothetical protein
MFKTLSISALMLLSLDAASQDPARTDAGKYKVLLENDRVRVLEYRDRPGERTSEHRHPAFVLYAVAPFKRKLLLPGGKEVMREFNAGDVMHSAAQTHIGENIGQTPTHAILVEIKQAAAGGAAKE